MQELEIEKRFLVPAEKIDILKKSIIPDSMTKMKDIYIPNGLAHKDLRLRQKGDTTTMLETTIELSEDEFNAMSQGIETSVEKERYLVDVSEWRGELDIFQGRHAGLVVVEFEFQNDADLADFEANAKLDLLDITNIEWLAGGRLAEIDSQNLKEKIQFKTST